MNLKTKRTICLMIGVASILTIVSAISYAYFSAMGDMTSAQGVINTATVSAKFTDNDPGITGELSFGQSLTKKFTITNTGTADASVKMYWIELTNTYLDGSLTYTLSYSETEDGPYTEVVNRTNVPRSEESATEVLANNLSIPLGKTYYYNLIVTLNYLNDVNQDADLNAVFYTNFDLEDKNYEILSKTPSEMTLATLKANSNGIKSNFDSPATTDEGIFEMEDDYGTSYYYRGAVANNYVKFAGFYWRIIRINGDGSLRIIYDGTEAHVNEDDSLDRFTHTGQAYNPVYIDAKYVGWMYAPAGETTSTSKTQAQTNTESSDIKKVVDTWYKTNIVDAGYGNAVADILFCNDRITPGKDITGLSSDTGLGYGKNTTAYGATVRVGIWNSETTASAPIFKCQEKNDAFTVSDEEKGNGNLTYPVGLITADEIVAAGGKYNTTNIKYYLYRPNNSYWSMTPYYFLKNGLTFVFNVKSDSSLNGDRVGGSEAVAPVINLSFEYVSKMIGDGTIGNEYRVE